MNDFVLESEGYCFLCLSTIQVKLELERPPLTCSPQSVHSLQCLSKYLKLDMRTVFFNAEGPIPPDLLTKVKNSKLKVELCEGCISLNKSFWKLYRKLEKIQMEVTSCVDHIREKLVKAKEADKMTQIKSKLLFAKPQYNTNNAGEVGTLDGKLGVVEALRKEAIQKCTYKVTGLAATPTVKIQSMTIKQVGKEKQKIRAAFWKTSIKKRKQMLFEAIPSSCAEIKGQVKVERDFTEYFDGDLPYQDNASYYEDEDSIMQSYDDDVAATESKQLAKDKSAKATHVSESDIRQPRKIKINESHHTFNTKTGKHQCLLCPKEFVTTNAFEGHYKGVHLKVKYKCNLCGMEFSYSQSYRRHHKTVHKGVRFKCPDCNQEFSQSYHLVLHKKKCRVGQGTI